MRDNRPGRFGWSLLIIAMTAGLSPAAGDEVHLRTGEILTGDVEDRGDSIFLKKKLGGVTIDKSKIERIVAGTPTAPEPAPAVQEPDDIVIQTGGRTIRGRATVSPDGREVWVSIGSNRVSIPRDHVRAIHWRGIAPKKDPGDQAKLGDRIRTQVQKLRSPDATVVATAKEELKRLGVFAMPLLDELSKSAAKDDPVLPLINEIRRFHALKEVIDSEVESRIPEVYERLSSNDLRLRRAAVKSIVLDAPKSAAPILVHLLHNDPSTDIRALCVSQLSMLRCFGELIKVLQEPNGRLRMAASVALGDQGILAGVPVLIDALGLSDARQRAVLEDAATSDEAKEAAREAQRRLTALRALADVKLREMTGQDFGYRPLSPADDRAKAIVRWRSWWKENGDRLLKQSARLVTKDGIEIDDERLEAEKFWRQGDRIQAGLEQQPLEGPERREAFERAAVFYKKAIAQDPTFVRARLSLAYLTYNELERYDEARQMLSNVLSQTLSQSSRLPRRLAYFHLAAIARRQGDFPDAELRLFDAMKLDEQDLEIYLALGDLYLDWSLGRSARPPSSEEPLTKPEAEARARELARSRLRKAQASYREGLEEAMRQESYLVQQSRQLIDTPTEELKSAALLQSLKANIRVIRRRCADFYYGLGRADAGLQFERSAEKHFAMAARLAPRSKRYKDASIYWKKLITKRNSQLDKRLKEKKQGP